jgi:2-polyprenyl-3-methyl-5-hydroxy-6-metoxy-1,4-benzoquinol methylase
VSCSFDREEWNRRYADRELLWTARPNRFLVAEVEGLSPGRALDVACGEGRNAVWLAERGWEVTAVDFSDVALRKARLLADSRGVAVKWVHADLTEYTPEPRAFELVIVLYLQLPQPSRGVVLRATAEAVAAGGTLVVVAHDSRNLEGGYGGPKGPDVLYTADDVAADLDGSGLAIEKAELAERNVETPEGERIALDALLRARR